MMVNKNISVKEKRRYALDNLGGVDFSSSPLLCAPNRSPDAVNWIGDHGINRKRHGWEQVMDTLVGTTDVGITDNNTHGRVNGIFPIDDGLLVYVGNVFYVCERDDEGKWKAYKVGPGSNDTRIQAWRNGNNYYIIGAGSLLCFDIEAQRFVSIFDSPYIPTTTINIGTVGSKNDVTAVLEHPNLLTPWRKNTLEGTDAEDGTAAGKSYRWLLDGKIVEGSVVSIAVEAKVIDESEVGYYIENLTITNKDKDGKIGETLYKVVGTTYTGVGHIEIDAGEGRSVISLSANTTPPIDGQANITVTFQADVDNRRGYITNCTFGTLFGVGGAQDRLFLSGNPKFPNVVFFSEANDFTYFPDQYTATFGTDNKPITGFLQLSDSVLAVLAKDAVYYQSGEYRTEYDDAGNIKKITPVFSITAGSINESAINPYTCVNFGGDNVFLSRNGVFGIEPTSNVLTNTRTARERSYAISARMGDFNASNAVMFTHGQRLYLSDGNACYVADSAYKYAPSGSESYNYEWWYWDHIPARVFAEVDGELWFGTEDGRICRFTDGYADKEYHTTLNGDIGIDYENKVFTYGTGIKDVIEVGRMIRFETEGVYAVYAPIENVEGQRIFVDHTYDYIHRCFVGDTVHVAKLVDNAFVIDGTCKVVDVSMAEYWIILKDEEDNYVALNGDEYLVTDISHKLLKIIGKDEYDGGDFLVAHENEIDNWDYIPINVADPHNIIATVWTDTPVVASWTSPPLDLGNDSISKTLFSLSVTAETGKNSVLSFGYETRKRAEEMMADGLGVFSFENMDFRSFSFENGFQTSYTVRARDRNFNFIRFCLRSEGDKACAVHRISAIYKLNKYNKGVV